MFAVFVVPPNALAVRQWLRWKGVKRNNLETNHATIAFRHSLSRMYAADQFQFRSAIAVSRRTARGARRNERRGACEVWTGRRAHVHASKEFHSADQGSFLRAASRSSARMAQTVSEQRLRTSISRSAISREQTMRPRIQTARRFLNRSAKCECYRPFLRPYFSIARQL